MIVSVVNTKGGVGKTTTALNLVISRAIAGRDVLAVDGDQQGTLMMALAGRQATPHIPCVQYPDGRAMRQQITLARSRYQDIVIDVGGRDSSALRAALMLADVVLIPTQPRSFDAWALDDIAELLAEARASRDIRALVFLAMADTSGRDNMEASEAIPDGLELLDLPVAKRKAIATAAGDGRSILETPSLDPKADLEWRRLVKAVFRNPSVTLP